MCLLLFSRSEFIIQISNFQFNFDKASELRIKIDGQINIYLKIKKMVKNTGCILYLLFKLVLDQIDTIASDVIDFYTCLIYQYYRNHIFLLRT